MSGLDTAVIGAAIRPDVSDRGICLEELLHEVVKDALADAGVRFEDIDGIVVAGNDQYDGRAITVMAASGSVGGVGRDIISTPSASEHAFVMGALRVQSGLFATQLVVSWSPMEADSLEEVQRLASDPYFHRALPLDELSAHALQASALEADVPGLRPLAAKIAARSRNPRDPSGVAPIPLRWPLTDELVAPATCGAVAIVLASKTFIDDRRIARCAWIDGMGWATEPSYLGDRDLSKAPALVAACKRAYEQAGIVTPIASFDIAELSNVTPYQELLAYEGLGLADRAYWEDRVADGTFALGGALPVNVSGGAQRANPVFCVGLRSIAEVADRIRGPAGVPQPKTVRRGLAHAASGPAMQYQTVVVLSGGAVGAAA